MSMKVLTMFEVLLRRLNQQQVRPSSVWAPSLEAPCCLCQKLTLFWRWQDSLQQATSPSETYSLPMTESAQRESSSESLNVICLLWAASASYVRHVWYQRTVHLYWKANQGPSTAVHLPDRHSGFPSMHTNAPWDHGCQACS